MTTNQLTVSILDGATPHLNDIISRLGSLPAAVGNAIGEAGLTSIQQNFSTEGRHLGAPWQALSPAYRKRVSAGHKILTGNAHLRNATTFQVTGTDIQFVNRVPYAARHNYGASGVESVPAHTRRITSVFGRKLAKPTTVRVRAHKRRQNTPQREFAAIAEQDYPDLTDPYELYLLGL